MTRESELAIARVLEAVLVSPNVWDSNLEPANLVDVGYGIGQSLGKVADAITPQDARPTTDEHGANVGSLTEAVMSLSQSASNIASAIQALADAVERKS